MRKFPILFMVLILLMLIAVTIPSNAYSKTECPAWVENAGKCGDFVKVVNMAKERNAILRASPIISKCEVKGDTLIIYESRDRLQSRIDIEVPGIRSCSLENGQLTIIYSLEDKSFSQFIKGIFAGTGVGYIIGTVVMLL